MLSVIPLQPKNWLTVLSVYVILLIPAITYPVCANPTVESTERTEDPTETISVAFDDGVILNVPSIVERSSYPMNKDTLK